MAEEHTMDNTQVLAFRKLTREQARLEQIVYWSRKTPAERIEAAADLTRRLYKMRGIDLNESKAALSPRRRR